MARQGEAALGERGLGSQSGVSKELQISMRRGPKQVNFSHLPGLRGDVVQAEHCTRGIVEGVPFAWKPYLFVYSFLFVL